MVLDPAASLVSVCDEDVFQHNVPRRRARVDAMSFNFLFCAHLEYTGLPVLETVIIQGSVRVSYFSDVISMFIYMN